MGGPNAQCHGLSWPLQARQRLKDDLSDLKAAKTWYQSFKVWTQVP